MKPDKQKMSKKQLNNEENPAEGSLLLKKNE